MEKTFLCIASVTMIVFSIIAIIEGEKVMAMLFVIYSTLLIKD